MPRLIRQGDEYTIDEEVDYDEVAPRKEPDINIQGEPWGWTKRGNKPKGWREDGKYEPN